MKVILENVKMGNVTYLPSITTSKLSSKDFMEYMSEYARKVSTRKILEKTKVHDLIKARSILIETDVESLIFVPILNDDGSRLRTEIFRESYKIKPLGEIVNYTRKKVDRSSATKGCYSEDEYAKIIERTKNASRSNFQLAERYINDTQQD